jgi:parallel beta-helix repeat protein
MLIATLPFGMVTDEALANHVQCGDVITQDTTLDADLVDCPGDGLVIGADDVTLDLNGHTVDGDDDPRPPGLGCDTGIVNGRFDNCSGQQAGHSGVTLRGGTVREFAHGVQVIIADRNSLLRLRLHDNSGFGGIVTYLMSNGRIQDNQALDNNSAGIAVYEPEGRTTITGNVMGRNTGYGIELSGGVAGDRFEDNVAFGDGADGFFFNSARNFSIRGNRSFANRGTGMRFVDGASENYVEGNRVWHNGGTGIDMDDGAQRNRVERNAVFRNLSGGITLGEGEDNRVVGNRILQNGGLGGIVIGAESRRHTIASNLLRGNSGDGIFLGTLYEDAGGMLIAGNHSIRNGADGIHVSQEMMDPDTHIQVSELRGNRTERNGDDGIEVGSDKVALVANRASWNFDLGIEAVKGALDGGRNRAFGNGNLLQCVNIACRRR